MTRVESKADEVIGHIQTDAFCEGCGYNLHTQAVTRDARLGILICRCPECGRYAAAGQATPASRVWLNRLASAFLATWALFLLVLFATLSLFLGMIAYGNLMSRTTWHQASQPMPNAPGTMRVISWYEVRPEPAEPEQISQWRVERAMLWTVTAGLGLLTGGLFAVLLWHCRGPLRALVLVPPLLGCCGAAVTWANDPMTVHVLRWGLNWIAISFAAEALAVLIGLRIGRPIARGLLRVLLPGKPRQHLAFLWTIDQKEVQPLRPN